tara:strand:- start:729 stop:899 length:171 start_codon:yes stop_codon:yes gene_type:complete
MIENVSNVSNVSSLRVSCDGELNSSSEGHPLVWLQIDKEEGFVNCPYCEKKFIFKE